MTTTQMTRAYIGSIVRKDGRAEQVCVSAIDVENALHQIALHAAPGGYVSIGAEEQALNWAQARFFANPCERTARDLTAAASDALDRGDIAPETYHSIHMAAGRHYRVRP